MARVKQEARLESVARAATQVFGRVGYQRTRTADVAAAAGMSAGSLFTYVQTKDALFHLVFLYGFGHLGEAPSLPVLDTNPKETVALIEKELRAVSAPELRAAMKRTDPPDVTEELRAVVTERYEIVERLWPMLAVIERCAVDIPELEAFYWGGVRAAHLRQLERYIDTRTRAGYFRALPDAPTTARVITESIAWFAWHRREGRAANDYDDDVARETVIEFAVAALVPEQQVST
jgi:AcrR family transcriptional regulator